MSTSIDQIKKLRELTGVSMTICKKALDESNGDMDKAIDFMRKKGEAKAQERAERVTKNGACEVRIKDGKGVLVLLSCETDFVSRNDDFLQILNAISDKFINGVLPLDTTDVPEIKDLMLKFGENIQLNSVKTLSAPVLGSYIHTNKKIAVLVGLDGGDENLARDIAMHVAALNPLVISPDDVDKDLIEKERLIWVEQLKNEGKPENIVEKILVGKEKKFKEENALISQPFVKDSEKTVGQVLDEHKAKVVEFVRLSV